jgi:hypothetical protein
MYDVLLYSNFHVKKTASAGTTLDTGFYIDLSHNIEIDFVII